MQRFWEHRIFRSRYPLAVLAGLLLAGAFPKLNISGLAWIAPGLLLASGLGLRGWERFRVGFAGGLTYYLASLNWLLLIPYRWHGVPFGPAAGWLALGAFMASFTGTWLWLAGDPPVPIAFGAGGQDANAVRSSKWLSRSAWGISAAIIWVGLEMVIARIFTGFPWDLLGVSQHENLPLLQISRFTGVYGVSFLIVWGSAALLSACLMLLARPQQRSVYLGEIAVPLLVLSIVLAYGFHQLGQSSPAPRTIKVAFVQPSIPQTLIWDQSRNDERFAQLIALSKQALTNHPGLMLWPEAAVPKLLRYNRETFEAVSGLARDNNVSMIVGADDAEPKAQPKSPNDADYYNSSFLISPEGKIMGRYRKRALVIFGEYIPLVTWLPFVKWFTPIEGGFTPGDKAVPFFVSELGVKTSVLICFEDVFPHLTREYVDEDTDFLVNLTNNGWFGEGAAQWQHAMSAVFRAVENGVPLLRCSNNGLTCWVDEHGRVRQVFHDSAGTVYGTGFMTAEIPTLSGEKRRLTFYTRYGDVFGWSCLVLTGMLVLPRIARAKAAARASARPRL